MIRFLPRKIVTGLSQAGSFPKVQGQAFAQALAQALNTQPFDEIPSIIIAAAVGANQVTNVTQGFAQVHQFMLIWHSVAAVTWPVMECIGCAILHLACQVRWHAATTAQLDRFAIPKLNMPENSEKYSHCQVVFARALQ